jgi:hypothetical protein
MQVEVDHAPSADSMPPHISMHMIGCTPSAAHPNATAARTAAGMSAAPSRRLQQVAGGAGASSVEVVNMSTVTPEVVFITTNGTGDVLASLVSVAVPPAYAGPIARYWLITAPNSAAIGAFPCSLTCAQHAFGSWLCFP